MIIRAEHTEGFLRVLNSVVCDTRLSCEACGLLVRMLSLPDNWNFSIDGLATRFAMSNWAVRRLIKELRDAGYVEINQKRDERGFFSVKEWTVYEVSIRMSETRMSVNHVSENGMTDNRMTAGRMSVIRQSENGTLLTTNIQTTKEQTTKEQTTKIPRGEFLNVFISDSEFERLTDRFGAQERDARIEDLSRYLAQHPKKKYASHYATILAWARKDQRDASVSSIPHTEDGIDWDRIARMAEEQFTSVHGGNNT